ncbi:MAG: hypothetical protein AABZ51_03630 [Nitrospirota bacterium]
MHQYIKVFNHTYLETANTKLPKEITQQLMRYPFLSGGIIGYVSTNFGAGFEYVGASAEGISIRRSSARIEDLFTGAPASVRKLLPELINVSAENFGLINCQLKNRYPLRLSTENASVRLIDVEFNAEGWERKILYAELYGNRSAEFWSEKNAIIRAKDEILLGLLDLNRANKHSLNLEEYLSRFKKKTVLVLGDYSPEGEQRLQIIKDALANLDYDPILLKDIPDDLHYDLQQKVVAVGSVVRFVVIEDSSKSGHLVEFVHAQSNRWVVILIRLEGSEGSYMSRGLAAASRVIHEQTYSLTNVESVVKQSVVWAEKQIEELKQSFMGIYPWRHPKDGGQSG